MSKPATVLVVDDDEVFNKTLCRALTRRGMTAFSAYDSAQALQQVERTKLDYLVLDLRLGKESGLALIEPILELQQSVRILVLTGYASLTTAVQAIKSGAFNYLAKPTDTGSILKALQAAPEAGEAAAPAFSPTPLKQLEWEHLQRVLNDNHGNISATARQLGMHRRTLQRKLQKKPFPGNSDSS